MNQPTLSFLLLLVLYGAGLTGQSFEDSRKLQLASTIRFGVPLLPISNFEPQANGGRLATGFRLETELEVRTSGKISFLAVLVEDQIQSYLDPDPTSDTGVDLNDPFGLVHPYTSRLETGGVQLGAQYNVRVGTGDVSFGIVTGLGSETYSRTYDVITFRQNTPRLNGLSYNESESVLQWISSFRFQYTNWISRRFAINLGGQLHTSQYLSGGIDTPFGVRYDIAYQEVDAIGVYYNLNYDRSTLTPSPSKNANFFTRVYLHFGVSARLFTRGN